jgi:hypothetical protein
MSTPPEPSQSTRPRAGRSRAMSIGAGISLITVGAILRFALAGGSPHGLNVHAVGVILILAGALGLLIPRVASRAPRDRLRRWVQPGADPGPSWGRRRSPREEEIQRAAAADVAEVEGDDRFFRPEGQGRQNDDL